MLASPTQLTVSDDNFVQIPIGFSFSYYGTTYNTVRVFDNAFVRFNTASTSGDPNAQSIPDTNIPNTIVAAAWSDLDPATGLIQYAVVGVAPLRVLVVEYINVRFKSTGDYVATQIQFYETSNIIEIHSSRIGVSTEAKTMGVENFGGTLATAATGRNKSTWTATNDFASFIPSCTDRKFVTVNPVPLDKTVTAATSATICQGGNVSINILNSQPGVTYELRRQSDNALLSSTVAGTGGNITIPSIALSSSLTIKARAVIVTTACDVDMLGTVAVTVNPVPIAPSITPAAPASRCQGLGNVMLTSSTPPGTVSYQWSKDGLPISGATSISYTVFDLSTNSGMYTVASVGAGPCTSPSSSGAIVVINALPSLLPSVTPAAVAICSGTSTTLTIAASEAGINYQVFKGASPSSGIVTGTGSAILITTNSFTTLGSLTVWATNPSTSCSILLPSSTGFAWKLIDQRGVLLRSGELDGLINNSKQVNVSGLANGVYFVMLTGPGGSNLYRKLVIMN